MYEFFKSALVLLLLLAALTWRRVRTFAVKAYFWANGGAVRTVRRDGKMRRAWSVPDGELCLCDVLDEKGNVLRTLARGNAVPEPSLDVASRNMIHGSIMSIEPASRMPSEPTLCRARDFLMERCAGFESTAATAAEVVLLMEAHLCARYHKRLTVVMPDFSSVDLAGDDPAMPSVP